MLKYTVKRLAQSLVTILLIATIVFLLMRCLPTDYYFTEEQLMKFTEEQKYAALEAAGLKADAAEVSMIPSTKADMDAETAPKLLRLIDMLEDCDDVQEVYHNGEISDEVAATL